MLQRRLGFDAGRQVAGSCGRRCSSQRTEQIPGRSSEKSMVLSALRRADGRPARRHPAFAALALGVEVGATGDVACCCIFLTMSSISCSIFDVASASADRRAASRSSPATTRPTARQDRVVQILPRRR
jgi:hypothetical protein